MPDFPPVSRRSSAGAKPTEPNTTPRKSRDPIVDPEGDWIWFPVAAFPTQEDAVKAAQEHSPDRLCYEPWEAERYVLRLYDEASEEGQATLDEFGGSSVAEPCGPDEGEAYWPIQLHPTAVHGD